MAEDHVNEVSPFSQQTPHKRTGQGILNLFRLESQIKGVERRLRATLTGLQAIIQHSIEPETLRLRRRERQVRRDARLAARSVKPADSQNSPNPVASGKPALPNILEITLNGVSCGHIELTPHETEKPNPR